VRTPLPGGLSLREENDKIRASIACFCVLAAMVSHRERTRPTTRRGVGGRARACLSQRAAIPCQYRLFPSILNNGAPTCTLGQRHATTSLVEVVARTSHSETPRTRCSVSGKASTPARRVARSSRAQSAGGARSLRAIVRRDYRARALSSFIAGRNPRPVRHDERWRASAPRNRAAPLSASAAEAKMFLGTSSGPWRRGASVFDSSHLAKLRRAHSWAGNASTSTGRRSGAIEESPVACWRGGRSAPYVIAWESGERTSMGRLGRRSMHAR
jgi:hypothetical protein